MLAEMSSTAFSEWMTYFAVEPFGSQLLDIHLASIESLLVNTNRPKNKSAVQAREFMLIKQPTNANPLGVFQKLKNFMQVTQQGKVKKNNG